MILIIIDKPLKNNDLSKIKKLYYKRQIKFLNFLLKNENILIKNFNYKNQLVNLDHNKAKQEAFIKIKLFVSNLALKLNNYFGKINLNLWDLSELGEINNLSKNEWNIFYKLEIIKQEITKNIYEEVINICTNNELEIYQNFLKKNKNNIKKLKPTYINNIKIKLSINYYLLCLKYLTKNYFSVIFFLVIYIFNFFIKNNKKNYINYYFSYYPFCWRNFNSITDQYYGDKINSKIINEDESAYIITLLDIDNLNIVLYLKKLINYVLHFPNKNKSIFFDKRIGFKEILKIYFNKHYYKLIYYLFLKKNNLRKVFELDNINYFHIFQKLFIYNAIYLLQRHNLSLEVAKKFKFSKNNKKINIHLYLFELSQTRALIKGFKLNKNAVKIYGWQHSIILNDKLLYQQRLVNKINNSFYPDYYLLDGRNPKNILLNSKFINEKNYKIIGANRLDYFINQKFKKQNGNNILFCSGWHDFDDLFDLAQILLINTNIKIIFTIHSKISEFKTKNRIHKIRNYKNFKNIYFTKERSINFFHKSTIAVTTYSTAGLEAIIYGIPIISYLPVYYHNINLFDTATQSLFELDNINQYKKILQIFNDKNARSKIYNVQYKYVTKLFNNLIN